MSRFPSGGVVVVALSACNSPGGGGSVSAFIPAAQGGTLEAARATRFNSTMPPADIYPGDGKWPYLNPPYFSILEKNNVIRVY